jgi:hypothetical protein
MFEKRLALAGILSLASMAATADDLMLEPCINGDVSPTGNYPTAAMEREIHNYLAWRSDQPYYLFAVSAYYLETPFKAEPEGLETR